MAKELELVNDVTKESLLEALQEINKNGVPTGRHSIKYDVSFEGKLYHQGVRKQQERGCRRLEA